MNNPRYTYMNTKTNRTNYQYSADRNTLHSSLPKPSMSKQAQAERSKQSQFQKINEMAIKIIAQVNRLHNSTNLKIITKEMIKEGGSQIFYDVFFILVKALDEKTDKDEVKQEFILGLLKLLNYPGFLGKNIFQPIGAPHTWIHCVTILDFMAEVARYASAFKGHAEEVILQGKQLQRDENYLIINAIHQGNPSILSNKLQEELNELQKKVESLNEQTQRTELHIRSLHDHQKPLQQVNKDIQTHQKRLSYLQTQLLTKSLDKQRILNVISKTKKDLKKNQQTQIDLNNQLASLEYKLSHNELSAEQIESLKEEIREGRNRQKRAEDALKQQNQRISLFCKQKITQLRSSHSQINFLLNQICLTPLSSSSQGDNKVFDNLDKLSHLCDTLLNTEQLFERNISREFKEIEEAWSLQSWKAKVNRIVEESKAKVNEKDKKVATIRAKFDQLKKKDTILSSIIQELNRKKISQIQIVSAQQQALEEMNRKCEKIKESITEIFRDMEETKAKLMETEEQNSILMKEMNEIQNQSFQFQEKMDQRLKIAWQAIENAKLSILAQLQIYKSDLNEIFSNSKALQQGHLILSKTQKRSIPQNQ